MRTHFVGDDWLLQVTDLLYDTEPFGPIGLAGSAVICKLAGLVVTTGDGAVTTYEDIEPGDVRIKIQFAKADTASVIVSDGVHYGEVEITLASGRQITKTFRVILENKI